jgi:hypothetical protein
VSIIDTEAALLDLDPYAERGETILDAEMRYHRGARRLADVVVPALLGQLEQARAQYLDLLDALALSLRVRAARRGGYLVVQDLAPNGERYYRPATDAEAMEEHDVRLRDV